VIVREALSSACIERREARLLLAEAMAVPEATLIGFPERQVPDPLLFQRLVERRRRGEPIAYILRRKEFYGLELEVGPAVLIPRPETELLVELALERRPASVLDLGTGSGAIALAIKHNLPLARVVATDASQAALEMARSNATRLSLSVDFRQGRWLSGVEERFELIVSNPPYVAEGDPHLAALAFEPRQALVSGADGLEALREIVREAPRCLVPGGWLLLEHGAGQDQAVRDLMRELADVRSWPDLAGIARVTGGKA
jgi:release factor glutamine methyltransferase